MTISVMMYPTFLDCSQFATDIFWKSVFEDLAYGKCPYGTFINKDFFCCNYKNKEFSYKIDNSKDPKILYNNIYNLLSNKLGLMSNKDKLKKRKKFEEIHETYKNQNNSWDNIKKKNIKNIFIDNYIIDKTIKYKLNIKQTRFLLSIIILGLLFKNINNEHIHYENYKIQNIDGIQFNLKSIKVSSNILKNKESNLTTPKIIFEKSQLSNYWYKYLNLLKQRKKGL